MMWSAAACRRLEVPASMKTDHQFAKAAPAGVFAFNIQPSTVAFLSKEPK
jgi:hypothetical protein